MIIFIYLRIYIFYSIINIRWELLYNIIKILIKILKIINSNEMILIELFR
jgi:hypothetical protein